MMYTNTRGRGAVFALFVVVLATLFAVLGQGVVPAGETVAAANLAADGEAHDVVMLPEVVVTASRLGTQVDSVASLNRE
jgi:hypothetical protein